MDPENSTVPAGEVETPETETETEAQAEGTEDQGAEPEAESPEGEGEGEAVVEEVEFDFGGNKFKAPKGAIPDNIAAELEKFTKGTWSDYTRKSQEVAEARKSLETRERAVEKLATVNGEVLNIYSRGQGVKAELEQLQRVDLNALWQSNPDQARRVSDELAKKQAEFQNIVSTLNAKEAEASQAQQAEIVRRADEGKQLIERRIKGFTQKVPEVIDYVSKTYGIPKDAAERDWPLNPATAEMAYKAMLYDRMQTVNKKPTLAPTQAAPVTAMKAQGNAKPGKSVKNMSTSEMARHLGLPNAR
jgi:hypothetical protein